jgi:hypothetical protein
MDMSAGKRLVALRGWAGRLSVAVTLALAGAGLAAASGPVPAFAAGPAWSVVPTPNRVGPSNGSLNAVSCVSASLCFAVGSSAGAITSDNPTATLIESWNGTKWSIMKSPTEGTDSSLEGLSCTSASACMAVGQYEIPVAGAEPEPRTLTESWNGSAWSIVPSATPATSTELSLDAVSCESATACTAVGDSFDNGVGVVTLIESWNGSTWSIVPSPTPAGASTVELNGVSCVSATACVAVGRSLSTTDVVTTLAESWNGSTWSIVPSPNKNLIYNGLAGVSCVAATSCIAVGYYGPGPDSASSLVESWNGSTWSVVPSPGGNLTGVSCVSATSCTAVGYGGSINASTTLAESWNGSKWSIVPSPNRGTGNRNVLAGVSCSSASACVAVGSENSSTLDYSANILHTLAESWQAGKWSILSTVDQLGYQDVLNGVSCVSASFCVAVGFYKDSKKADQTLAESWNGSTWSTVTSPDEGSFANQLNGVSCVSPKFCVAAGTDGDDTLIEFWNGTSWSIVSSPDVGGDTNNYLGSVSCVSATSCMAVGSATISSVGVEALTESWNGSTWSIAPSSPAGSEFLTGVSCVAATSCIAVGWYNTGEGPDQTESQSWNGSTWSLLSSPDEGTGSNTLAGVSCASASFCTAVGAHLITGRISRTLIESWNGSTWSIVPSPHQGTGNNTLAGVSCRSASFCTAAGAYVNASGVSQTLIESWNGSTWSIVPSPDQDGGQNQLRAVSCASTTSCTAVGDEVTSTGNEFNLAELFG